MTESLQIHLGHLSNAQLRNLLANAEANGRPALAQAIRREFARRRGTGAAIRPPTPRSYAPLADGPDADPAGRGWAAAALVLLLILGVSGLGLWQRDRLRRVLLPPAIPAAEAPGRTPAPRAEVALATPPKVTLPLRESPAVATPVQGAQVPQTERVVSRPGRSRSAGPRTRPETAPSATELAQAEPEQGLPETALPTAEQAGVLAVSQSPLLAEADCGSGSTSAICEDSRRAAREARTRRLADQPVKLTIPRALASPARTGPPR